MKVKVDNILVNIIDGKHLKADENGQMLTVKWAFTQALLGAYPKENIDGNEKYARYKLASKINETSDQEIELTVEEVAKLKKLVGEAFPTMVCGQIYQLIGE